MAERKHRSPPVPHRTAEQQQQRVAPVVVVAAAAPTQQQQQQQQPATPTSRPRGLHKSLTLAATSPVGDRSFIELASEVSAGENLSRSRDAGERAVAGVEPPETRLLTASMLWGDATVPNVAVLRSHLLREGRLETAAALRLVSQAHEVLAAEPNVLTLAAPLTVCGDIHGQFYDLVNILERLHAPGSTPRSSPALARRADDDAAAAERQQQQQQFLFLGDYVDRGDFSTEVLFLLLAIKICYPRAVWLLRGNHETRMMAEFMTFQVEVDHKYQSDELYEACCELFDSLPLAAVITGSRVGTLLAVHGGIGPDMASIQDIAMIDRFQEPPASGTLCDVLWSDPLEPPEDHTMLTKPDIERWKGVQFVPNVLRQTSFMYGLAAVRAFLEPNGLAAIIRAHQVVDGGFKEHHFLTSRKMPHVLTVFTAPNYCDMYGNKGAVLHITHTALEFEQFDPVPHPFFLPDFADVVSWSLPYLMESLVGMLSDMVVSIKEENSSQVSEERRERDALLGEKMQQMRLRLQDTEIRRAKLAKAREELLRVDHPNFERFRRAMQMDIANEQCPAPRRRLARRPLERTSSWVW